MGKTFTHEKRLLLLATVFLFALTAFAQNDIGNKLSVSTQMFLQQRDKKVDYSKFDITNKRGFSLIGNDTLKLAEGVKFENPIADPVTLGGKRYIEAYIRLDDNTDVSLLDAKGVQIQCKFNDGLVTAIIPVDSIESVASLSRVKKVEVAERMKALTDKARQATNVDDVLNNSNDARVAGLKTKYDGSGVLVGIVDQGIDFQHKAFKDKNGNTRIKRAYYFSENSSSNASGTETSSILNLTTDNTTEDHGTHTSSIAAGSNVIVNGSTVTVTDDASQATYGGMAPGADLYLAGLSALYNTRTSNAIQKICQYADNQNEPVVINNSWGATMGPHDGTSSASSVISQYFGDSHPNHVILFSSGNSAGHANSSPTGGGLWISGTASSSNPLGAVLGSHTYRNTDDGCVYQGTLAEAWTRSSSSTNITVRVLVINTSTGEEVKSFIVTPNSYGSTITLSDNGTTYYNNGSSTNRAAGTITVYRQTSNNKRGVYLSTDGIQSNSISGDQSAYTSNYRLAVQFYPSTGSSVIDAWGGSYCYFTNKPSTSGYTWTQGDDKASAGQEPFIDNTISVGAYVTKNSVKEYTDTIHDLSSSYPTVGDIAYFSSYEEEGAGPTGKLVPWITAPGATIVAAVNAYDTNGSESYINGNSAKYGLYRVNSDTSNPYGNMEGTSMACPVATGIVALWLQAAKSVNKNLTVNDVKDIMKLTAIKDSYVTSGPNASHFGNGKIDALKGIQYILTGSITNDPSLTVDPTSLSFTGNLNKTTSKTVKVTKANLTGNVTVKVSGTGFSVSPTTIAATDGTADLTVNFTPTTLGTFTGTVTLTSGSLTTNIALSGTAATLTANPTTLSFSAQPGSTTTKTVRVKQTNLTSNVTATVTGTGFSVSPTSIPASADSTDLTVTFAPTAEGNYTGTLTLTSGNLTATVALTGQAVTGGTATDVYLNIANYKTIGTNQSTSNDDNTVISNIYKYTEDADNSVAWLTLSAYAAGTNEDTQKWLNVENWRYYSTTSWTGDTPFQGSSAYFTSDANARVISTGNSSNRQNVTANYFVTNTSEVRALGNNNGNYSTTLNAYECTLNSDGTLTASGTAAKTQSSSTRGANTLILSDLSPSKIYKIEWVAQYGNLREIAFKTPITVVKTPTLTATPTALTFNIEANTSTTQTFTVTGKNLTGDVTATLTDANNVYSLSATTVNANDAAAGKAITVTFSPKAAGTFTGTVTLTSEDAQSVTVTLNGTAVEQTSPVRYKSSADDTWHYLLPDANGAYNITDGAYYAFEVSRDVENATVNYTRNFTSGTWAAWAFPVDITTDADLLNDYQFGYLEGVSNEGNDIDKDNLQGVTIGVKMLTAGKTIRANLPYVVLPQTSGSKTFTFNNVTLKKTAAQSTSITGNSYVYTSTSVYSRKSYANDTWYALTTSGQLRRAGNGAFLTPFRFFLSISDNAGNPYDAKSAYFNLNINDQLTGINGVDDNKADNNQIYDLQGRRVYKPTQKGVYIVNGRKVVFGK